MYSAARHGSCDSRVRGRKSQEQDRRPSWSSESDRPRCEDRAMRVPNLASGRENYEIDEPFYHHRHRATGTILYWRRAGAPGSLPRWVMSDVHDLSTCAMRSVVLYGMRPRCRTPLPISQARHQGAARRFTSARRCGGASLVEARLQVGRQTVRNKGKEEQRDEDQIGQAAGKGGGEGGKAGFDGR